MKLIGPFRQLVTMEGLPLRGALSDSQLEVIPNGGILISDRKILATGDFKILEKSYQPKEIDRLNTSYVAFPGLIDCHTHICWAGSRANDYALRLEGRSYQEIAALGGGIWDTVKKTRNASVEELAELTAERANNLFRQGVTTIEVKSGYGLLTEEEIKILEAIAKARLNTSAELIATCLAAHIVPRDYKGTEEEYLSDVVRKLLPEVADKGLSNRVDIFIDKGAFTVETARAYLQKAKAKGFEVTIHGDQFTTGTAQLAVDMEAVSIDHLEAADDEEINILADGNVIPVVLPGASLGLGEPFAPARKLLDSGTSLAIASDWNPGSAPMGNLIAVAAILGAKEKLTMAETWAALTYRAAAALNRYDRGILRKGAIADIAAFKTDNYKEVLYQQGQLLPGKVWKSGFCTFTKK